MKNRSKILVAILPVLACFAFLPGAQGVCEDGCNSSLFNTFQGDDTLFSNTSGTGNTAFGWRSLFSNTDGSFSTGVGAGALVLNNGSSNTAVGAAALLLNTSGTQNTAVGTDALVFNDSGTGDTAIGYFALMNDNGAGSNTAVGSEALVANTTGINNTAVGESAGLLITDGNSNVCIGQQSGGSITTGSNIITIGPVTGVHSIFGQVDNTTYIANILGASVDSATAKAVFVDADGRLGTVGASAGPEPRLPRPATPKANPDAQAMLNRKVEALEATVAELRGQLKEQAAQIQKVSTQLEMSKPAAKVVVNKP